MNCFAAEQFLAFQNVIKRFARRENRTLRMRSMFCAEKMFRQQQSWIRNCVRERCFIQHTENGENYWRCVLPEMGAMMGQRLPGFPGNKK